MRLNAQKIIVLALSLPVAATLMGSDVAAQTTAETPAVEQTEESAVEESAAEESADGASSGGIDDATGDIGSAVDDITGEVDSITEDVTGEVDNITEDVTGEIEGVTEGLQEQVEQVTGDLDLGGIDQQIEEVTGVFGDVTGAFEGIIGDFQEAFSGIFNVFNQFGLPDMGGIFENPEEIVGLGGGSDSDDGGSGNTSGGLMTGSQGVLGLPDPEVIEENINQSSTSPTEEALATLTGGDGSPVLKLDAKELFDADLAEEVARASALTADAQERLAQNVEVANTALETSQQLGEDSEGQDVSQNILRNISVQAAQRQATDTLLAIDAQRRQRDDAIRNIVESDSLRQLKRDRVAERRQDASAYNFAITLGGLIALPNLDEEE